MVNICARKRKIVVNLILVEFSEFIFVSSKLLINKRKKL